MKRRLILFALLPYLFLFSSFNTPEYKDASSYLMPIEIPNGFFVGIMQSLEGLDINYDELGINYTHHYLGTERDTVNFTTPRNTPYSDACTTYTADGLFDPTPTDKIQEKLQDIYDHNQSRIAWMRPKIEWLCFGQSSIYQAEPISVNDDYWFYSYNERYGEQMQDNIFGNGSWVMHCGTPTYAQPNYVVKRLKANSEQCRRLSASSINTWMGDSECDWYVKPRMRIPATVPGSTPELAVCLIHVLDQLGNTIKADTIKAKHFLDANFQYDGSYLEEFYFDQQNPSPIKFTGDLAVREDRWIYFSRGTSTTDPNDSMETDINVEWLGGCEMWLDYVKVENDVAHNLLSGDTTNATYNLYNEWIEDELEAISGYEDVVQSFYLEMFEFNNISCIEYINNKIKTATGGQIGIMVDQLVFMQYHVPWTMRGNIASIERIMNVYNERIGSNYVFTGNPYPFTAKAYCESGTQISKLPNTITASGNDVWADKVDPAVYDEWLQKYLDDHCPWYEGGEFSGPAKELRGVMQHQFRRGHEISKEMDIPYISMLQAHQWVNSGEVEREPTIQEQDLMSNLAINYGAKGVLYWWYKSDTYGSCEFTYGITNENHTARTQNVYLQPKWDSLKRTITRLKKWGMHIADFDNTTRKTAIWRFSDERNSFLSNTYFADIITYKEGSGIPPCVGDDPGGTSPNGYIYECNAERYLQSSVFTKPNDNAKYFMITNRRCSPFVNENNTDNIGGRRKVIIKLDMNDFTAYKNWTIYDLEYENNNEVLTFSSSSQTLLDLGNFLPGQGRLYKIAPTASEGGTLVTNEVINGSLTIKDTIFTDGFNFKIEPSSNINFEQNGMIVMEGGNFICGDISSSSRVTLAGSSNTKWNGIRLEECDTVEIFNTDFEELEDSCYAVDMINCALADMQYNVFTLDKAGALRGTFTSQPTNPNIVFAFNTLDIEQNKLPVAMLTASSVSSIPLYIDGNTFISPTSSFSSAVTLTNITGGLISGNAVTNYYNAIVSLSSSYDLYQNAISSNKTGNSIIGVSSSNINMKPSLFSLNAGENEITNSDADASNVEVQGSYIYADGGDNSFNIADQSNGYHFTGYFGGSSESPYPVDLNCWKLDGNDDALSHNVTWGLEGMGVQFTYTNACSGGGGGFSSKTENDIIVVPITENYSDTIEVSTQEMTTAIDSLNIAMRKREYSNAINIAERIVQNTSEEPEAIDAISKIYTAGLRSNDVQSALTEVKSILETAILNNPNNAELIRSAFYYIQKSKCGLGQYQSALDGFEMIMDNNPNTYEALIAGWDYAATTLMMGQGGSQKPEGIATSSAEGGLLAMTHWIENDPRDEYDKQKFSKEDRKVIRTNVVESFKSTREKEESKTNVLKERKQRGDKNAAIELKRKEIMNTIITKREPSSIIEYINSTSKDAEMIFSSKTPDINEVVNNLIPDKFELYQNYPNPFNPVTKIKYALPKDAKVSLVIYDLLGRKVITLIQNEVKTAGVHSIDFNGTKLSSGVYFYRIGAGEFSDTKRMVMVK